MSQRRLTPCLNMPAWPVNDLNECILQKQGSTAGWSSRPGDRAGAPVSLRVHQPTAVATCFARMDRCRPVLCYVRLFDWRDCYRQQTGCEFLFGVLYAPDFEDIPCLLSAPVYGGFTGPVRIPAPARPEPTDLQFLSSAKCRRRI